MTILKHKWFLTLVILLIGSTVQLCAQSASLGNTYVHAEGEAVIFGIHDFNFGGMGTLPGIVGTQREGQNAFIGFSNVSPGWTKAAHDRHIDGYVKKYGDTPFVFPIGDNGRYRPAAISGADQTTAAYYNVDPQTAITSNILGGAHTALPETGPFNRNQKDLQLFRISDKEYWDINGNKPTRITLTWDANSNVEYISDGQLSRLTIVGWDGSKWVRIPSVIDLRMLDINRSIPMYLSGRSNKDLGSISTQFPIAPNTYDVYTLASVASGIIGDFVWEDSNRNGVQDIGEDGIPGVQVQLFDTSNALIQTVVTDVEGIYFFQGVLPGRYYVRFAAPFPYSITLPSQLPPDKNSDVGFDGRTPAFNIGANQVDLGVDAGFYKTGYIGDFVWNDEDRDGIQDEGEKGVGNIVIELLGPDKLLLASTFSDSMGMYFFTNLPPGNYFIRVVLPDGYLFSPYKSTLDINKDSDVNPFTGITDMIQLNSGVQISHIDVGLASPCKYIADIELNMPTCGERNGGVDVFIDGNTGPYSYEWSTGDTTAFLANLDTGLYTLMITDQEQCSRAFSFELVYEQGCQMICADLNTAVFLEGAYDYDEEQMLNDLNRLGYLPGQRPTTFFGKRTSAGQPYNQVPWSYKGNEGSLFSASVVAENNIYYDEDVIDWVLVSLRLNLSKEYETCTRAGLLYKDGHIEFPEDACCLVDPLKQYYVVVEHRNHLIVMSPTPRPVIDGRIDFDFRSTRSYVRLLGESQREVSPGVFAMYAGNGDQFISGSSPVDINVADLAEWLKENGLNSSYYKMDFDLNGDVNVQDKALYLQNNGLFSDVPKTRNQ